MGRREEGRAKFCELDELTFLSFLLSFLLLFFFSPSLYTTTTFSSSSSSSRTHPFLHPLRSSSLHLATLDPLFHPSSNVLQHSLNAILPRSLSNR